MTSHTEIPDELCRIADEVLTRTLSIRAALEAVAPSLRAQGMREAAAISVDGVPLRYHDAECHHAILARANQLEGEKG